MSYVSSAERCFRYFFISVKSNDITNIFVKMHSCTENCVDLHIRYSYVPSTFENKDELFAFPIMVENRQL